MFKTATVINSEVQKEISKKAYIIWLTALIVGIIGLVAYIVLGIIFPNVAELDLLLFFSMPFGFGLVFVLTIKKQIKSVQTLNQVNTYEFFEDHVVVSTVRNMEVVGSVKVYYKDLTKSKETEKYFLLYLNNVSVLPIKKDGLKKEEQVLVRAFLNLQQVKVEIKK